MGGVEVLVRIMEQVLGENSDFAVFRACENEVAVLRHIPVSDDDEQILQVLMSSNCMNSMVIVLQRSGAEECFLEPPHEFVTVVAVVQIGFFFDDCDDPRPQFPLIGDQLIPIVAARRLRSGEEHLLR